MSLVLQTSASWSRIPSHNSSFTEQTSENQLRLCVRHVQEVIIPKLNSQKTLVVDKQSANGLNPSTLFPLIIAAVGANLESLRFDASHYPSGLKEITRCPNLKKLTLVHAQSINCALLFSDPFAPQSNITDLILESGFPAVSDDDLVLLSAALPHLSHLSTKISSKAEENYLKKFLQYFPHVKLDLSIATTDVYLFPLVMDAVAANLESLRFDPVLCPFILKKVARCANLKKLTLINAEEITSEVLCSDLFAPQSAITDLAVESGFPAVSDDDLVLLAAALPHLSHLSAKIANQAEKDSVKKFLQYFPHVQLAL